MRITHLRQSDLNLLIALQGAADGRLAQEKAESGYSEASRVIA
jgi:hypothetical protein